MITTIPCKSEDGFECPYLTTCLARLTDRTITGCGVALYMKGLITYDEIRVRHTIKEGQNERIQ